MDAEPKVVLRIYDAKSYSHGFSGRYGTCVEYLIPEAG